MTGAEPEKQRDVDRQPKRWLETRNKVYYYYF